MKFHERFDIDIKQDELERRFLNRVNVMIMDEFWDSPPFYNISDKVGRIVALLLGEEFYDCGELKPYYGSNYYKCLQTIEMTYSALQSMKQKQLASKLSEYVESILKLSELDTGIEWKEGTFIRKGVKYFDDRLINNSLEWLYKRKYLSIYEPFSKGLKHFIESNKNETLYKNVIIDMYESLEALSKIVTGRDGKDLSANQELLLKGINATDEFKQILKEYIYFANKFRHSESQQITRPNVNYYEVESFVYLTGFLIRLYIMSEEIEK